MRNLLRLCTNSLCNLCVLCDSVVDEFRPKTHHRDTENTEIAQRRARPRLLVQSNLLILVALLTASCQNLVQTANVQDVARSSQPTTTLHFPQSWLGELESDFIQQLEVRKLPNSSSAEFFFAALPKTALRSTDVPAKLFKQALWIEGGYMLLPQTNALDTFALW